MTKSQSSGTEPKLCSRLRVLCGKEVALGPGRVDLLEHIDRTGTLRAAAAAMGMSYMRAWTLMKSLNDQFRKPLVVRVRGGKAGGGAVLTDTGKEVVMAYRRMERQSQAAIQSEWKELRDLLKSS